MREDGSMRFCVLTLFPQMIEQGMGESILGNARQQGLIELQTMDIRDYTENKHRKVDDYTYGGGAGMLMQAQPVYDAYQEATKGCDKKPRTIYVTPQGRVFDQKLAVELSKEKELVFLCGHYEGVDERVLEEIVTDRISIGDYVLTGGELPALVIMDAVSRLVPGVLHNEESARTETFDNDLLEYPQYTRPECWHGKRVPQVLLSGDHRKINAWRLEEAKKRTKAQRPDLYAAYEYRQKVIRWLSRKKRQHIHMMELLKRNLGRVLAFDPKDGALLEENTGVIMLSCTSVEAGERLLAASGADFTGRLFCVCQEEIIPVLRSRCQATETRGCYQAYYTRGVPLPVSKELDIRRLDESYAEEIFAEYHELVTFEELKEHLARGDMYGAFVKKEEAGTESHEDKAAEGKDTEYELAGFIGTHSEGALGMLQVRPRFHRRGIATALESYMINEALTREEIPFGQIFEGNEASLHLQRKLGLNVTDIILWWVW